MSCRIKIDGNYVKRKIRSFFADTDDADEIESWLNYYGEYVDVKKLSYAVEEIGDLLEKSGIITGVIFIFNEPLVLTHNLEKIFTKDEGWFVGYRKPSNAAVPVHLKTLIKIGEPMITQALM